MVEANESDELIERLGASRRRARGLRVAARRAMALARQYRDEEGPRGVRETACVRQALMWRATARELLGGKAGPGLARASVPAPAERLKSG